jgi:hypothetical protein
MCGGRKVLEESISDDGDERKWYDFIEPNLSLNSRLLLRFTGISPILTQPPSPQLSPKLMSQPFAVA